VLRRLGSLRKMDALLGQHDVKAVELTAEDSGGLRVYTFHEREPLPLVILLQPEANEEGRELRVSFLKSLTYHLHRRVE
ncbi:MAG: hypothetical protein ACOC93_02580, partial [Planctomycetota bacterium]